MRVSVRDQPRGREARRCVAAIGSAYWPERQLLRSTFLACSAGSIRAPFRSPRRLVALLAAVCALTIGAAAHAQSRPKPVVAKRTAAGKPDISGIWEGLSAASFNVEDHAATFGPVAALGAQGAVPPGFGVVKGQIPYLPAALTQRDENYKNRLTADPEVKCYRPGVPRATYMPQPFQILQTDGDILIAYQYANALRTVYMKDRGEPPVDSWMGWSNGHWEGDVLVVDVTAFNEHTWFDRAGNYHSDELHVVERYTPISPYHLMYEATIEDPKLFTRPWKVRFPLYRRVEDNVQLVEFNCVPFVEELMYDPVGLYKPPSK